MVRHNNMIPNGHFNKKWQGRIKTWFSQPMRKLRRYNTRVQKRLLLTPKPAELLRPAVRCPTSRYNAKMRAGRGFTLQELKQAGINKNYARTIGIAVDFRRRNKCHESLSLNVARLKNYQNKLILLPSKEIPSTNPALLNTISKQEQQLKARKVGEGDQHFKAFITLRLARNERKQLRRKLKKNMKKEFEEA